MLPLLLLGLPWSLLPLGGAWLALDAVVVEGAMLNVALHLALVLGWRRQPIPRATQRYRTVLAPTRALISASLLIVVAVGVTAASSRARQADEIAAILPIPPWTVTSGPHDGGCVFCWPQSARVDLGGLWATPPPEVLLLTGIDARLGHAGFAPDEAWDCEDIPEDTRRFLDPGEPVPKRVLRSCYRGFTTANASALTMVQYSEGNSVVAWIDINWSGTRRR